jgi:hypothetical protein
MRKNDENGGEDFFLEKKKPSPHPSQKNRLRENS